MANVTKLTFNYSTKRSKNYNSVEESEGFEITLTPEDEGTDVLATFEQLKTAVRIRVDNEVEDSLKLIPEKADPFKKFEKKPEETKEYLGLKQEDDLEGL